MSWTIELPIESVGVKIADVVTNAGGDVIITTIQNERIIFECTWLEFLTAISKYGYHINYVTNVITTLEHPISMNESDFEIMFADVDWYFDNDSVTPPQSLVAKLISKIKLAMIKFAQLGI